MMRNLMLALFVCLVVACGTPAAWGANAAPVVSNVVAAQRPGTSQMIDITYDLADVDGDLCSVWVAVSDDDGATWTIPAQTFAGDWGPGVLPGVGKQIAWDAGSDIPGKVASFRIRVCADDGNGPAAKVLVPAGQFPYQNSTWTYVPTFMIDKYEVTNAFYCQFLNNADPTGAHWVSGMQILRSGSSGSYTYTVQLGKENYPIAYVNKADAEAFAAWRTQLEGVTYRLPSEQEWEKAAAWDPLEQRYYTYGYHSDSIDSTWCNYNYNVGTTTPVGYYNGTSPRKDAKSYYGCYDMSGNLWEWMRDLNGSSGVLRGGGWDDVATNCACTYRYMTPPSRRYDLLGFRLVLGLP